jgi:hypothetical protein
MNARFLHRPDRGNPTPSPLHDDTIQAPRSVPLGPACCCPARPVVQVVLPATTARPHQTELLLCGHHYRVSRQALATANAAITELPGPPGWRPDALLPDPASPRIPVS